MKPRSPIDWSIANEPHPEPLPPESLTILADDRIVRVKIELHFTLRNRVPDRRLIVLSFEALATAPIGCYGSSWNQTPAMDAIAAHGCVWDRWLTSNDDSRAVLADWFGTTADPWTQGWRELGSIDLITDDESVGERAESFDTVTTLPFPPTDENERPATEIESTQLAALIAAAIERDGQSDPWSVMWLHSRFLASRWDAPRELFPIPENELPSREPSEGYELISDELELPAEEPIAAIFDSVVVPRLALGDVVDPDLVTSWMRTYGCQVRLIDLMIEVLLNSLTVDDPLLIVVGTSGFSLGQNGWIGHGCGTLRSPEIRLPMILSDVGPIRLPQPTSQTSLVEILRDLSSGQQPWISPKAWVRNPIERWNQTVSSRVEVAATTSSWFFVRDVDTSEHLFLKPDDVEDFNDIARLRPDVVAQFDGEKKEAPPVK